MTSLASIFAVWLLGTVVALFQDRDLRAPRRERVVFAMWWPVSLLVIASLVICAAAGMVRRAIVGG